jgi:hypothetical protein
MGLDACPLLPGREPFERFAALRKRRRQRDDTHTVAKSYLHHLFTFIFCIPPPRAELIRREAR